MHLLHIGTRLVIVVLGLIPALAFGATSGPSVATPASATPSLVTGTATTLRVLGADPAGESTLTYTWSLMGTPPGSVTFTANGTHAARTSIAKFTVPGSYNFLVTITDQSLLSITSSVSVSVPITATSLALTPLSVRLNPGVVQPFTAVVKDQWGNSLSPQPTIAWSVAGGTITSSGVYTAGATPGGPFSVTAITGTLSKSAAVTINAPPSVATPAAASTSPVTTTTVALSTVGADDLGEPALKYTWSTSGTVPATVAFSPNGTNAAKTTTATFKKAGSYPLVCTIKDGGGLTVTTNLTVTVNQTVTTIAVSPTTFRINSSATKLFTATVDDQFGIALVSQPTIAWSASGGGTIATNGILTAGPTPGGPFTVSASSGSVVGTASVVVNAPPTVATVASISPSPVTGTTATVRAQGADDAGESLLKYKWSTTGPKPAAVAFTPNNTNAAKISTATFSKAGAYTLQCTITDGGTLAVTTTVSVTVQTTATSLVITPLSTTVATSGTQTFVGTLRDQFGLAVTSQPTLTWTVNGGGSIASSGLFTAGMLAGGPYTITATGGGFTGQASVVVTNTPPSIITPAAASPNAVTGTSTALSILGQSSHGASVLTYTWSTIGSPPASVSFTPNGSNAAQNSTATFHAAGSYVIECLVADGFGGTATSTVSVAVSQTVTTIVVTPSTISVPQSGMTAFSATANDQFGIVLIPQPAVGWTVTGPGTIDGFGNYTGSTSAGGPYTVSAADGSVSGTAAITVINAAPTVATPASAAANPVTGTTVNLTVLGADDAGPGALTYSWSATGTPAGPVSFSPNSTNAAQSTTATFSAIGTYTLQCVLTDTANLSIPSFVTVTVTPTATTIAVSPTTAVSQLNGTSVVYSSIVADQFGALLVTQPTVTWSIPSAAGAISTAEQVIAASIPGGPYTVTASIGSAIGTAQYTVVNMPPNVVAQATASVDPSGISASLSVLGADDGGATALTYTWSVVGSAAGAVGFMPNGTNAAQVSTAIFSVPGTYTLQVVIADAQNLTATSQVQVTVTQTIAPLIGTIAGSSVGSSGIGGPALIAELNHPNGLAVDTQGNIYVADWYNSRICLINAGTHQLSIVAGITGYYASSGDGGPATAAAINQPLGVALDGLGNLYIAEYIGNRIRQVNLATGIITTIAGTGVAGYAGDGGLAINAMVNQPGSIACDAAGNVYVTDLNDEVVRRIDASSGVITTIAGPGSGPSGDGGPATAASFNGMNGIAIDRSGNIFVIEYYSSLVRRIDASTGIIATIASNSSTPSINGPNGISCDALGNVYVSNYPIEDIIRIDRTTGVISTFVGSGSGGLSGDGGLAINAGINGPSGSGFDAQGAFYFCDRDNAVIRIVTTGPVIATPAAASQSIVTTASTVLTVMGATTAGESTLSYSWAILGSPPGPVQFSINGTNTAKSTTATFSIPGTYLFEVTVSDGSGRVAVSQVQVAVVSTPVSGFAITPTQSTISINGFQQYICTVSPDQFGVPNSIPIYWTISSGSGFIDQSGFYTAYAAPGTNTINAYLGTAYVTATVTVVNMVPTFAIAANANPNPVTGIGTRLAAYGSSVGGESSLTYFWSVIGTPPAPVTLGVNNIGNNGSNAAKITSAQFTASGTYTFQVTATDSFGVPVSSQVTVTVNPTLTSMTLSPNPMYVDPGVTQSFSATGHDQFGHTVAIPSAITWSLADTHGLGTLSSQGVFSATTTIGGPSTVTAISAGVSALASVYVGHYPPIAQNQALYTAMNTPIAVNLIGSSPNQDSLTYSISATPGHGTLSGTPPAVIYAPQAGFLGTDNFTFTVSDGQTTSTAATVTIQVLSQIVEEVSTRSPLIVPIPFDSTRWAADPTYQTNYLMNAEPGRIWQSAAGAPGIPTLVAAASTPGGPASRIFIASPASIIPLVVQGTPNAPVTFLSLGNALLSIPGLEGMASRNCITVAADATGKASISAQLPVSGRISIVAASPLAVGQVRYVVKVQLPPPPPPPTPLPPPTPPIGIPDDKKINIVYTVTNLLPEVLADGTVFMPNFTSILVKPNPAYVTQGGYLPLTAIALDQLGQPLVSQPIFTWTMTNTLGLGRLTAQGVFFANYVVGGPSTITASSTGISVSVPISVTVPGGSP